jgi:Spy/CpxP family protein refolding chaperone
MLLNPGCISMSITKTNNMHMKKYFLALATFIIITITVTAQTKSNSNDSTTPPPRMGTHHKEEYEMHKFHHHGMMMAQLNLTHAQKQQAKSINDDYRNQLKEIKKNDGITLKDYRSKKASLEQERKSKLQALLTTVQKNEIAQAKKDRSETMKMMAQKRIEKMKTDLNLTDDQVAKIQEQRKISIEQMKATRENSSLSEDQKKEQLTDLYKSMHESLKSILTADQLKKKEELRNNRMSEWKNKRSNKDS